MCLGWTGCEGRRSHHVAQHKDGERATGDGRRATGNEPTDQHRAVWPASCHGNSCLERLEPTLAKNRRATLLRQMCTNLERVRWNWNCCCCYSIGGMSQIGEKTCSSVTLSTKKPTWNRMGSNLYLSAGVARFVFRTKEQCKTRNWTHVCYQQTEQLSVAHRLPTCYHHYLIFQLKLITPLQIIITTT